MSLRTLDSLLSPTLARPRWVDSGMEGEGPITRGGSGLQGGLGVLGPHRGSNACAECIPCRKNPRLLCLSHHWSEGLAATCWQALGLTCDSALRERDRHGDRALFSVRGTAGCGCCTKIHPCSPHAQPIFFLKVGYSTLHYPCSHPLLCFV